MTPYNFALGICIQIFWFYLIPFKYLIVRIGNKPAIFRIHENVAENKHPFIHI